MPLNIAMPPKGDHKENYASVIQLLGQIISEVLSIYSCKILIWYVSKMLPENTHVQT